MKGRYTVTDNNSECQQWIFCDILKDFFHGKIQSQLRLRRFHQPLSSLLENQIQSRQAWILIMRSSCVELVG
jgi:hypothetical protein